MVSRESMMFHSQLMQKYATVTDIPRAFLHADMEDDTYAARRRNSRADCKIRPIHLQKMYLGQ